MARTNVGAGATVGAGAGQHLAGLGEPDPDDSYEDDSNHHDHADLCGRNTTEFSDAQSNETYTQTHTHVGSGRMSWGCGAPELDRTSPFRLGSGTTFRRDKGQQQFPNTLAAMP